MTARYPVRVIIQHIEAMTRPSGVDLTRFIAQRLADAGVAEPVRWQIQTFRSFGAREEQFYCYPPGWDGSPWTPENDRIWRAREQTQEHEERMQARRKLAFVPRVHLAPVSLGGYAP